MLDLTNVDLCLYRKRILWRISSNLAWYSDDFGWVDSLGEQIHSLTVAPDTTVEALLEQVKGSPNLPQHGPPVSLDALQTEGFQPTTDDLKKAVSELGLSGGQSITLHLWNGCMD